MLQHFIYLPYIRLTLGSPLKSIDLWGPGQAAGVLKAGMSLESTSVENVRN